MSNNVKLQVLLRAVDQASRPFKSIRTASKSLSGDIRDTQKSLRELNGHASRIEGFRKTRIPLNASSGNWPLWELIPAILHMMSRD